MREEFEKLPEIAMVLEENPDIRFEDDNYIYHGLDEVTALATMIIFGAYFAYQEQQKKIDALQGKISKVLYAISQSELYGDRAVWGIQDEIKEILK